MRKSFLNKFSECTDDLAALDGAHTAVVGPVDVVADVSDRSVSYQKECTTHMHAVESAHTVQSVAAAGLSAVIDRDVNRLLVKRGKEIGILCCHS